MIGQSPQCYYQVSLKSAHRCQRRRFFFIVFTMYEHGGHLGHVTLAIYISFFLPKNAPHDTWIRLAKRFQRRRCMYYGNIHVYCPGVGADLPLRSIFFRIINPLSICQISIKFFPSNDILTIFPIHMHGRPMLTLP